MGNPAEEYIFRFDVPIEPVAFGGEVDLSGWLLHRAWPADQRPPGNRETQIIRPDDRSRRDGNGTGRTRERPSRICPKRK